MNLTNDQLRIILALPWLNLTKIEKEVGLPSKKLSKFIHSTYTTKDGTVKPDGLKEKYRTLVIKWLFDNLNVSVILDKCQ